MPVRISRETFGQIKELLAEGVSAAEIGRRVSVDASLVAKVRGGRHSLQTGYVAGDLNDLPTPREIEQACRAIRLARAEGDDDQKPDRWEPPLIRIADLPAEATT